ncbi:MAG: hypothetical protein ABH865_04955 [Candidatus Omnitrophota bacterium]|nr:hypothetical protein [Candidatus Omnitrophota bacterium]
MGNLRKLQKFILSLIIGLVWFEILCFTLIFVGSIFNWSFLSKTFSTGFFSAFGIGLGALAALAILHVTLTLNSISFSLSKIASRTPGTEDDAEKSDNTLFAKIIISAIGIILLIILSLWFGEININKYKAKLAKNGLESLEKSPLANKTIELINQDVSVKELIAVRDAMMNTLEGARGLSLLVPINKADTQVFYEITPWWWSKNDDELNKPLSQAALRRFVPYEEESKKFTAMLNTKVPFYSLARNSLRYFYPVTRDGKIAYVLLLDTSRQASDSYLTKRGDR